MAKDKMVKENIYALDLDFENDTELDFVSKTYDVEDETEETLLDEPKKKVLSKIEDIAFCQLTSKDVVRHPLVQKIVKAYEIYETKEKSREKYRSDKRNNH